MLWCLLERKHLEEMDYDAEMKSLVKSFIIDYFKKQWVVDESVCGWYQAVLPQCPMTNNSLER